MIDFEWFSNPKRHKELKYCLEKQILEQNYLVIKNTPIKNLSYLYRLANLFFNQEENVKNSYAYHTIDQKKYGNIGYMPFRTETAVGHSIADEKEFYHIGPLDEIVNGNEGIYPNNKWPKEIINFELEYSNFYRTLNMIAGEILKFIAKEIVRLPSKYVNDLVKNGNSILRLIKYPKITKKTKGQRAAPHTGINLIGLCLKASSNGLEYINNNGTWNQAPNIEENQIIVNIGEMLAYLSNGLLEPSLHRVTNPQKKDNDTRFSMVFFYHPNSNKSLVKLNEQNQEQVKAGDWLNKRLNELNLN